MSEIHRPIPGTPQTVEVEVVEDDRPSWEFLKSEWATGHYKKLGGQLRQARAAAHVKTSYGAKSTEEFAKDM